MRSTLVALWRLALHSIVFLVGWAPVVALAIWSASYLGDCVDLLEAPGVPVTFSYIGAGVEVKVRADSYSLDLSAREARVFNLSLSEPGGGNILLVDRIEAAYKDGVPVVVARDVTGRVTRLQDGRFDVERAFPQRTDEPSEAVLRLVVDRADIVYRDEFGGGPLEQRLSVENLRVDQAGESLAGSGALSWTGGSAQVGFVKGSDGRLEVSTQADRADIAPWVPIIARVMASDDLRDYRPTAAERLMISGTARLAWREGEEMDLSGRLQVSGTGVSVGDSLDRASVDASATGAASGLRLLALIRESNRSLEFDGRLSLPRFRAAGQVVARASSDRSLWPPLAAVVPPDVGFTGGTYKGWVDLTPETFGLAGEAEFGAANYGGDRADGLKARLVANNQTIRADIQRGEWSGLPLTGQVFADWESRKFQGEIVSGRARLEGLAARLGIEPLCGIGQVQAILTGTVDAPIADIYLRGSGGADVGAEHLFDIGQFEVRAQLNRDRAAISRLFATGPNGVLTAKGDYDLTTGAISFEADGGAVEMSALDNRLAGLAFFQASIGGSASKPETKGRFELYGLEVEGRGFPQIVANFSSVGKQLKVSDLDARAGAGHVRGSGQVDFDSRAIAGSFTGQGILLSDWIGGQTFGAATIPSADLSGSLDDPRLVARIEIADAVVHGLPVDNGAVLAEVGKERVDLHALSARIGQGLITAQGRYEFATGAAGVEAQFQEIPLGLMPGQPPQVSFEGLATGTAEVTAKDGKLTTGKGEATIANLKVNGTDVGAGQVTASLDGSKVAAEGSVGSVDRYVILDRAEYDMDSRWLDAQGAVYRFLASDLSQMLSKPISELPEDFARTLSGVTGSVSANFAAAGPVSDPDVDIETLQVDELTVAGRAAGTLTAGARRVSQGWEVSNLKWDADGSTILGTARYWDDGRVEGVAEAQNFDLTWLNTVAPAIPLFTGRASAGFSARGTTESPTARGWLAASDIGVVTEAGERKEIPVRLDVPEITLNNRVLEAKGAAFYEGLSANLTANVPLSSLATDGVREPLSAVVELGETDLSAVAEYVPWLGAGTNGTIRGDASIRGVRGAFRIVGSTDLVAERVELIENGEVLTDVRARAAFDDWVMGASASGQSAAGGSFDLVAKTAISDPWQTGLSFEESLRDARLEGLMTLSDLKWRQRLPFAEGRSTATASGQISISGTPLTPVLSGEVGLADLVVRVPEELPESGARPEFPINPKFEGLKFTAASKSAIITSSGHLSVEGTATINGTLAELDVSAPLSVEGGTFRLPTTRVAIEQGGGLSVSYRPSGDGTQVARVDLNLQGSTNVTARKGQGQYESYVINLHITGNLLDENGLNIQALSEPPDLSQDEILAILGQKEVIEGLIAGGLTRGQGELLRDSLYSVGVPAFTQGLTEGLASGLNIDYISLDYNPFDQAMISAGKTLGKGLLLQATRQVFAPAFGEVKYDLRLTYRLPLRGALLSRVRLGVGVDQDRPWKVTLDWSRRF